MKKYALVALVVVLVVGACFLGVIPTSKDANASDYNYSVPSRKELTAEITAAFMQYRDMGNISAKDAATYAGVFYETLLEYIR